MNRLEKLNFYEILEVGPGASQADIRRAYEHAKKTYHVDSIAMYSLLDEREIQEVARLIEEAYHTIGSEKRRREYDRMLGIVGAQGAQGSSSRAAFSSEPIQTLGLMTARSQKPEQWRKVEEIIAQEGFEYTGSALRKIRETFGLDLRQISERTKVSRTNLRFLEEENYPHLPAVVYLRGFLNEYARCLGLDASRVLEDYVRRYRAWQGRKETKV